MNHESAFPTLVRLAFQPRGDGAVGLVDRLLVLCQEYAIRLDWKADHCWIRSVGIEPEELIELPLPKSVFRAVLARLAALCNEHRPGSVSPYEGQGELAMGGDPSTLCRVVFVNTPSRQEAQLTGLGMPAHGFATTSPGELSISQQSKTVCG